MEMTKKKNYHIERKSLARSQAHVRIPRSIKIYYMYNEMQWNGRKIEHTEASNIFVTPNTQ